MLRPLVRIPASNNIVPFRPGGPKNQRIPPNPTPGNSDALNPTWNVRRPPGNPNGRSDRINNPTRVPSGNGSSNGRNFNWGDAIRRAAKEAFNELIRPPEIPELPIDLPEYNNWVRDENRRRGYPSPNKFPDYGNFGPPEPENPKVIDPQKDNDWPEPKRFPGMPNDAPKVPSAPVGNWEVNLPGATCKVEVTIQGYYHHYSYDYGGDRPGFNHSGPWATSTFSGEVVNPISVGTTHLQVDNGVYWHWYILASRVTWKNRENQTPNLNGEPKKFYIPGSNGRAVGGLFYWPMYHSSRNMSGFDISVPTIIVTFLVEKPDTQPLKTNRNKGRNPDNMQCQQCQARQMLREMSQTITVDSVTISKLPTGDLLSTTTKMPKRVFALPGTQEAVRDQFNLLAELKRRTASAFNQARRAKVLAKLVQVMNFTQFWLTFHNALMMSADIGETFFGAIFQTANNVAKLVDDLPILGNFFDLDEAPFDSQELITSKIEGWAKEIFGVKTWAEMKAKFAALNQIIRSTNTMVMNMRDLGESQRDLAEMSAERVGKLNNALRKAGVTLDEGNWMSEDVNMRSRFLEKLEKIEESGVINAAVFLQQLSSQALDIKETKKEVAESKQKFQEDLTKGISTITGQAGQAKTASEGANITKEDIAK